MRRHNRYPWSSGRTSGCTRPGFLCLPATVVLRRAGEPGVREQTMREITLVLACISIGLCLVSRVAEAGGTNSAVYRDATTGVQIRLLGIGSTSAGNRACVLDVTVAGETIKKKVYRKGDSIPKTGLKVSEVTLTSIHLVADSQKVVLSLPEPKQEPEPAAAP